MLGTLFSGDIAFMATLRTRDLGRFNPHFDDHHMSGHGLQLQHGDAVRFEGGVEEPWGGPSNSRRYGFQGLNLQQKLQRNLQQPTVAGLWVDIGRVVIGRC